MAHAVLFRLELSGRQQFLGGSLVIILYVFGSLGIEDVVSTAPRGRKKRQKKKGKKEGVRLVMHTKKVDKNIVE